MVRFWNSIRTIGLNISWCLIRVHKAGIKLKDQMGILKSYLNNFKQPVLAKDSQNLLSNIMFKYIIVSCFKKMYCRAFHWALCFMIKNLTGLNWESVANFKSITIKNDQRFSDFLRMNTAWPISNNNETFGEYVMTFNHSKSRSEEHTSELQSPA